ncbi:Haloacid dehalogenase-like hydrolase [Natranaerofaba carboxydovora]|nr:HAD-IA family hydrolase [Natranaerofaba carboxydovora]UMZ73839.1 Haloacid dehalogenase-like hydrolase [Natranaerofaba carboxydovora]
MDNTLLSSRIDFDRMKQEIFDFLVSKNLINQETVLDVHTVSTIIQKAKESRNYDDKANKQVWEIILDIEKEGMKDACLEPGVVDLLTKIYSNYILVVLTNNSNEAAVSALKEHTIDKYFDYIVTRDHVVELKPSPGGVKNILKKFDLKQKEWLLIGDSWIDGRAAINGGISFLAYKANEQELKEKNIEYIGNINHIKEVFEFI